MPVMPEPVIRVSSIRKTYGRGRRGRRVVRGPRREDLRPDRSERRRQDDHDGVRGRAARPDRGRSPCSASIRSATSTRCSSESACSSSRRNCRSGSRSGRRSISGPRCTADRRGRRTAARAARARRQAQRVVHDAVGRAEAAPLHRAGAHQRSRSRVSRRADDRPRSAGAAGDLGYGARHPRARQDRVPHDASDGGSREAVRPRGDHRARPDHGHRNAGGSCGATAPSGPSC